MPHKMVFINDVVSPKGTFAFPHLSDPDSTGQYADDKYKVTLLMPKDSNRDSLKKAVLQCIKEAWPDKGLSPKDVMLPFRNGDEKPTLEGYPGTVYITAKNKKRVRVVDPRRDDIDPAEAYAGAKGRLVLTAMSYEQAGKPGVTFKLEMVQKLEDGEHLGGGSANTAVLDDGLYDAALTDNDVVVPDAGDWGDDDDIPF